MHHENTRAFQTRYEPLVRIEWRGQLWDRVEDGELEWEWPTDEHPEGRLVRKSCTLTRYAPDGSRCVVRVASDEVTIAPRDR